MQAREQVKYVHVYHMHAGIQKHNKGLAIEDVAALQ